ncbi:hypothetical protein LEN26_014297 [Aphanomyces euteiches]|nr:hypothetical protein LEN26_014297 [Aphanomyces euteiches]KAH9112439.1 hypothetical protein AeMF1_013237 [Aphanomyces euteiches]KAH9191179.1 hypothetical protein AeNC1_006834 [Aphanomyces euteiches]
MRFAILSVLVAAATVTAKAADFLFISGATDWNKPNPVGLSIYSTNLSNGQLTLAKEYTSNTTGNQPTYMAISRKKKFLYLTNEVEQGQVASFRIRYDGKNIALDSLGLAPTNTNGPVHLVVTDDNRFVILASYNAGAVTVLEIDSNGKAGKIVDSVAFQGASLVVPDRQERPHAHCVALSPCNCFVYVTDLGNDKIMQFRFDPKTGKLQANNPSFVPTGAGSLPRHMVFHPRGDRLYLTTEYTNELVVFDYNKTDGNLKQCKRVKTTNATSILTGAIHATEDGHILVSNRGVADNSVVLFTDDLQLVTSVRTSPAGQNGIPRDFTVFNGNVYVANQNTNNVPAFTFRNNAFGPTNINISHFGPQCLLGVKFQG